MDGRGVTVSAKFKKYFRRTLWVGTVMVNIGATSTLSFGADGADSIFNCTNIASGAGWQIKINFHTSTVDSIPARISDTTISWRDPADGGNYTLDRNTGDLTVVIASSTGGYFIHDRCRPRD
jgi:hypothetical protein